MCQALFQNYSFCLKVNAIKSCWQSDLSLKSFFFLFYNTGCHFKCCRFVGVCAFILPPDKTFHKEKKKGLVVLMMGFLKL